MVFEAILTPTVCAAHAKDHETLCTICRYFTKKFQFVSDSYRLYAALNRLCNLDNEQFHAGPSQKYVLRQLKAMDVCLSEMIGEKKLGLVLAEKVGLSSVDEHGDPITAKEVDIALLALYGHMLYATGSYAYGIRKLVNEANRKHIDNKQTISIERMRSRKITRWFSSL
jgi:general transcription factor 3C polypeptide 3 (transcription factor C subunit 4)